MCVSYCTSGSAGFLFIPEEMCYCKEKGKRKIPISEIKVAPNVRDSSESIQDINC